jgi:hypothetical protein
MTDASKAIKEMVQHAGTFKELEILIKIYQKLERPPDCGKELLIAALRGHLGQLRADAAARAAEVSTMIDALEHQLKAEAAKASLRAV